MIMHTDVNVKGVEFQGTSTCHLVDLRSGGHHLISDSL